MNKKWLNIILWSLYGIALILLLSFVNAKEKETPLQQIEVDIAKDENRFINNNDIVEMILKNDSLGKPLISFKLNELEKIINNHPDIEKAEIYKSINGKINVEVVQRKPIIRVFSSDESYYIDQSGKLMPVSKRFTARVPVASLQNKEPYGKWYKYNFSTQLPDSVTTLTLLDDAFKIASFIRNDTFLKAQIEQMFVNKDLDWVLIPKVGNHTIVLGSADDLESKFKKLKLFYLKALKNVGWDKYQTLNLKYKNQVVCTKKQ
jgi:cell division protein FtsQ